ncbi:MAG: lipopolysaccharide biosynthesis protein [Chloroflexales bacterium]|nr:lipopolysaccharide biosynthesis protein [Chloroflexales bacterium]
MVRIVLLRFLESYFRHRWLYLLPIVIALGVGAVFVATASPVYVAAGRLYVEKDSLLASLTSTSSGGSLWVTASQATTNEITELIASQAFTRSAIQKTDLEKNMSGGAAAIDQAFTYFRSALSVQPQGDKLVEISATSEDPKLAQQMVLATMEAYIQWKLNSDFQESVAAQSFFQAQIQPYKDEVDKARGELIDYNNANPQPVRGERPPEEQMELDRLQADVKSAEERLAAAQANEESARLAQVKSESVTRQTFQVIDQPQMPTETTASLKDMIVNMAIFLGAGLFLSLAGIGAGALLDRSLCFPIDVRHGLSLPVLAMVPTGTAVARPMPVTETTAAASKSDPVTLQPQH